MNEIPDISSILNMLNSAKTQTEDTAEKEEVHVSDDLGIDIETMMKVMSLVRKMKSNENDASANLLKSLKPFLRESKQEKIEQYIKFIKLSNIISEMNDLENKEW